MGAAKGAWITSSSGVDLLSNRLYDPSTHRSSTVSTRGEVQADTRRAHGLPDGLWGRAAGAGSGALTLRPLPTAPFVRTTAPFEHSALEQVSSLPDHQ